MKSLARFILGLTIAIGFFAASLYTSCKKQNNCAGVSCMNKGHCADGFCVCPTGVGGDTCENIFKKSYANTYGGTAYVNTNHIAYRLVFSIPSTATDFVTMALTVESGSGAATNIPVLPVVLVNPTSTVGNFNITATTINGATYTGSGTLYAKLASLTLNKTVTSGIDTTYICSNFPVE